MNVKHVVVTRENKTKVEFFLPGLLDDKVIEEFIRAIRMGDRSNWTREFRHLELVITEEKGANFEDEMKYIVLGEIRKTEFEELMFIFSKDVDHDRFYEVMQMMMLEQQCIGNENYAPTKKMSAGFIYSGGGCHGKSETLRIGSRPEDKQLFKKWFT